VIFDPGVKVQLHPIEQQRLDIAGFGADLQTASGVMIEVCGGSGFLDSGIS
jgi:hypothetical protein